MSVTVSSFEGWETSKINDGRWQTIPHKSVLFTLTWQWLYNFPKFSYRAHPEFVLFNFITSKFFHTFLPLNLYSTLRYMNLLKISFSLSHFLNIIQRKIIWSQFISLAPNPLSATHDHRQIFLKIFSVTFFEMELSSWFILSAIPSCSHFILCMLVHLFHPHLFHHFTSLLFSRLKLACRLFTNPLYFRTLNL